MPLHTVTCQLDRFDHAVRGVRDGAQPFAETPTHWWW
jgi:hypothetical protein